MRDGKRVDVPIATGLMPPETERKPPQPTKEWFGLRVTAVTPDIAKQLGLTKAVGVVIEGVEAGSMAQEAGLRKGDVILEVNRQRIENEDDYRKAMEKGSRAPTGKKFPARFRTTFSRNTSPRRNTSILRRRACGW